MASLTANVRSRALAYSVGLALLTLAALALRIWSKDEAYGLFVDEALYAGSAQTVIENGFIPLTSFGVPFLLHPLFVFLLGAFAVPADLSTVSAIAVPDLVHALRWVNILAGALTIPFVMEIVRRSAKRAPHILAFATGLLFALDPYILRHNGRYLLETVPMLCLLVGLFIVMRGVQRKNLSLPWAIVASLSFGLAILSKDTFVFTVFLPMLGAAFFRLGGIARKRFVTIAFGSLAPVILYYVWAGIRYGDQFTVRKLDGLRRFLGMDQATGVKAHGAPSIVDTLASQVGTYWTSYALLALAVPATLYLLRKGTETQRLVAILATAAGAQLSFGILIGTLEEQFLYVLIVPAIIVVMVAWSTLLTRKRPYVFYTAVGAAALALGAGMNFAYQAEIRSTPDDAYQNAVQYILDNTKESTAIAWAQGNTHYQLETFSFQDRNGSQWATPGKIKYYNVKYVLTQSKAIEDGYSYVEKNYLTDTLPKIAHPVFTQESRWSGTIQVWQVDGYSPTQYDEQIWTATKAAKARKMAEALAGSQITFDEATIFDE
jgi:hypothetical protein